MNVRITPQAILGQQLNNLRRQTTALATAQRQLSSGIRLLAPSDDPAGMAAYLRAQSQEAEAGDQQAATKAVLSRLQHGSSILTQSGQLLNQAYQIALEGANSNDPAANEALAQQVDGILDQMLSHANEQADGRYLFGGTETGGPPFAVTASDTQGNPTAIVYQGSANRASIPLGEGPPVDMLYTGQEVFQRPGAGDVFAGLMRLRDQLRNGAGLNPGTQSEALSATAAVIQAGLDTVLGAVGEMSTSLQSLTALDVQLGEESTQLKIRLGELGGTDFAAAFVEAQTQETLLQATLAVSARIFSQNLLDYI